MIVKVCSVVAVAEQCAQWNWLDVTLAIDGAGKISKWLNVQRLKMKILLKKSRGLRWAAGPRLSNGSRASSTIHRAGISMRKSDERIPRVL
jgi:hypothetical protein